jgi:hypothetical protein
MFFFVSQKVGISYKKEAAALFLHAPASPLLLVSYQILIH